MLSGIWDSLFFGQLLFITSLNNDSHAVSIQAEFNVTKLLAKLTLLKVHEAGRAHTQEK